MTFTGDDIWMAVGFVGQMVFGGRFVVQWIATERKRKSVVPTAFWYMSLVGTLVLLAYSIYRRDIVFIAGFSLNLIIYVRNLYFIHGGGQKPADNAGAVPPPEPVEAAAGSEGERS